MSKVKRTPIPLPGRAAGPASTPSKPPKLASTPIAQDDSSSDESTSSGASSSSESDVPKTMKVVEKTKEAEPASSSAASDDSSEESSEDEESSEESGESEESAEAKKTEATKKTATNGSAGGSDSSHDDSESESEEESEEEAAASSTRAPDTSRLQTTQTRISKPFEPPSGFKPAKLGLHPSSNLAKLLQSTDLSKKQIWHITAPANIDIKQVKQFAHGKAALKEPAIEHKGVGYAFIPEEKDTRVSTKLLVPTEKGYAAVPADIAETFYLQQIVDLPKLSEKQAGPTRSTAAVQKFVERPEKPARPQPEGLRMRYKPCGASEDVISTVRSFVHESAPAQKRKHGAADASAEVASPKKSKKDKKHKGKSHQENGAEGEPMEGVESTVAGAGESEKKKKKKDKEKEGKKEKKEKKRKE